MLLVFGGLPASGKSTISKCVARRLCAAHIRVDTIEQCLRDSGFANVYSHGYELAYRIAADNLSLGITVVADSVNGIRITRDAWRVVGETAGVPVLEIEIICSDKAEHKRRVELRPMEIDKLIPPTWNEVLSRVYEPWQQASFVIDTAGDTPQQSICKTLTLVESHSTTRRR